MEIGKLKRGLNRRWHKGMFVPVGEYSYMKFLFVLLLPLIDSSMVFSQKNILFNGDFEEYTCNSEDDINAFFPVKGWSKVHRFNTTDYFNSGYVGCYPAAEFVFDTSLGHPYSASSGNSYIGMITCALNLTKEAIKVSEGYIEPIIGILTSEMHEDSLYEISMSVNIPSKSTLNTKSISVVFLNDTISKRLIRPPGFIELKHVLDDKVCGVVEIELKEAVMNRGEWFTYQAKYRASGSESHVLLGFFPDFPNSDKYELDKLLQKGKLKKYYRKLRSDHTFFNNEFDQSTVERRGISRYPYLFIDDVHVGIVLSK